MRAHQAAVALMAVAAVTSAATGVARAAGPPEVVKDGANPAIGVSGPTMLAVQAFGPDDVWGVGRRPMSSAGRAAQRIDAFTAHYDGASWTEVAAASPSRYNRLNGIDGLSSSDLWAVGLTEDATGKTEPLAEHWDGTKWTLESLPDPGPNGGELSAVLEVAPDDVYVAGWTRVSASALTGILDHWDGSTWTALRIPHLRQGAVFALTGTARSDVWAAGYRESKGREFTDHFDGALWSYVPPAAPGSNVATTMTSVAPDDVWAAGRHSPSGGDWGTLTEHFDGTSWRRTANPNPPGQDRGILTTISAVSSNDVWAAGDRAELGGRVKTLVEHWDGETWSIVPSPNPRPQNYVYGISADSPDDAWLVGAKTEKGAMFVEHWNGTTWEASTPF